MTTKQEALSAQAFAETHVEPRFMLLFIVLGLSTISLVASFSLLAAAVYIH
jgi:hypothetical protein